VVGPETKEDFLLESEGVDVEIINVIKIIENISYKGGNFENLAGGVRYRSGCRPFRRSGANGIMDV
jgi:hypothetical protein